MSIHLKDHKLPKFTEYNLLSSKLNGGKILFATDDWFAEAEQLLKETAPIFQPDVYTEFGKLMDGWETRRKRIAGHDWCIIKLGMPGILHGIDVDTSFFTGNFAPKYSIQAAYLTTDEEALIPSRKINSIGTACTKETLKKMNNLHTENWTELIPMTKLQPGYTDTCHNYAEIKSTKVWTHLRLNIFPDGGIARLRVYGESRPLKNIDKYETIDLVSIRNGGLCTGFSNAHFGHPRNLIRHNVSESMDDGWETARRLDRPSILQVNGDGILEVPGNEWACFRLGFIGTISSIIVDTKHFKGNYPDSVQIEGILVNPKQKFNKRIMAHLEWKTILPKVKLHPNQMHEYFKEDLQCKGPFSHVKIIIAPDGGFSRLKIYGTVYENFIY